MPEPSGGQANQVPEPSGPSGVIANQAQEVSAGPSNAVARTTMSQASDRPLAKVSKKRKSLPKARRVTRKRGQVPAPPMSPAAQVSTAGTADAHSAPPSAPDAGPSHLAMQIDEGVTGHSDRPSMTENVDRPLAEKTRAATRAKGKMREGAKASPLMPPPAVLPSAPDVGPSAPDVGPSAMEVDASPEPSLGGRPMRNVRLIGRMAEQETYPTDPEDDIFPLGESSDEEDPIYPLEVAKRRIEAKKQAKLKERAPRNGRRAAERTGNIHEPPCEHCEKREIRCEEDIALGACVYCRTLKLRCKYSGAKGKRAGVTSRRRKTQSAAIVRNSDDDRQTDGERMVPAATSAIVTASPTVARK